jgi:hypothetical protein
MTLEVEYVVEKREKKVIDKETLFNLLHKKGRSPNEISKMLKEPLWEIQGLIEFYNIPSPTNEEVEYAKLRRRMKKLERKRKFRPYSLGK